MVEPTIEVAREGRTLRRHELNQAIKIIKDNREYLLEQWYEYKGQRT